MRLLIILLFVYSPILLADCTAEDVVDLLDQDYTTKQIREECQGQINSSCSIIKIKRLYNEGYNTEEITSQCTFGAESSNNIYQTPDSTPARVCVTNYGACPMVVSMPRGMSCYCSTGMGSIAGITQ